MDALEKELAVSLWLAGVKGVVLTLLKSRQPGPVCTVSFLEMGPNHAASPSQHPRGVSTRFSGQFSEGQRRLRKTVGCGGA